MRYNISKELFEEVNGFKVKYFENDKDNNQIIFSLTKEKFELQGMEFISYNNFFFKCKEWALEQGYELVSDSEKQAVFAECQRILDNKEKQ